jgi:DNA-binding transcriptional LysR family regulator
MSDRLALFQTFIRVAEAGSFTSVAAERNTSQPTISRQIAQLEDHLGCLLLQRTTRSLTLTDDGRQFYDQARAAVDAVASAESAVGRRKGKPTGTLKLACAVVMGRLHVVPRLPRFLARYPDVSVELSMNDGFTDMVEEGIDLAIRVGELTDPGLIARRIGTTRRVVVATPDYLARKGEPRTPADLAAQECIVYERLATGANWPFLAGEGPLSVPVSGHFHVNNTEGVRTAVLNGMGIGIVPIWHFVDREIETGRVKVLLTEYEPKPHPINAVYPSRRHLSPKIRAMIDFLAAEFELDPKLSGYGAIEADDP